jgi:putative alpha-1,2-mannosidase
MDNGKILTIEAKDQSDKNIYVSRVLLNGRPLNRSYLTYADLAAGGKIVFEMSNRHG